MTQRTVRPGQVIKKYIQDNGPTAQAALHKAYVKEVAAHNEERAIEKKLPLSSMSYASFRTMITRARLSELLEVVEEKPGERTFFTSIKDGQVVPAYIIILGLTAAGQAEVAGWDNLQVYHNFVRGASPTPQIPETPSTPAAAPGESTTANMELAKTIHEKWKGTDARNSRTATRDMEKLQDAGHDVHDLEEAIEEYQNLERSDYESAEEYSDARGEAWDEVVEKFGELAGEDEEEGGD